MAVAVITDVLRGYGLSGDDTIEATRALRALPHGFVTLQSTGGVGYPVDVDHSFRRAVTALVDAIRQWSPSLDDTTTCRSRARTLTRVNERAFSSDATPRSCS